MTTRRARIQSGNGSPFRISVAGVDSNLAEFDDLIFDGDQNPLRRAQYGSAIVSNLAFNNLAPATFAPVVLNRTYPSGKFPVFSLIGNITKYFPESPEIPPTVTNWKTPSTAGSLADDVGGGVDSNYFYAINYARNVNDIQAGYATIQFLIFNNIF